jgi:hypothetical protein
MVWDRGEIGLIFAAFSDPTNKYFGPSTFIITKRLLPPLPINCQQYIAVPCHKLVALLWLARDISELLSDDDVFHRCWK